jgi:hypothetical protein
MIVKPQTKLGKWSVWLNACFLIVIVVSVVLVKVLGVLSFDDKWWDVTVLIFLASIAAFVLGIIAITKKKERSVLVYISVIIGLLAILFIFLHSLFISD